MTGTKKPLEVTEDGLCWCGSGKPYAACHQALDDEIKLHQLAGEEVPTRDMIKTPAQIAGIRKACALNTAVLDEVAKYIRKGMTTEEIDQIVYQFTVKTAVRRRPWASADFRRASAPPSTTRSATVFRIPRWSCGTAIS